MKNKLYPVIAVLLLIFLFSCKESKKEEFDEEEYKVEMFKWKMKRIEKLKAENGWLNLIGLHWINEGINMFGSNEDNDIIFPEGAPGQIGAIIKFKGNLSISINDSIEVYLNDSLIKDHEIKTDKEKGTTFFKLGRYKWHIIQRNGKYALRLRDLNSSMKDSLQDIPSYPLDINWRIEAEYQPFANPLEIEVGNVLGTTDIETCYGTINFTVDNINYELYPLGDGKNEDLFLIFADKTSAIETYGGGRYLYINKPDSTGKTIIDFNKATNPPCAFTEFATCPLPPKENIMDLKIRAGEKKVNILEDHK